MHNYAAVDLVLIFSGIGLWRQKMSFKEKSPFSWL